MFIECLLWAMGYIMNGTDRNPCFPQTRQCSRGRQEMNKINKQV